MPDVLILMGSDSDAPVMQGSADVLKEFGISNEMTVASAHRSPERVMRLVREAPDRGVKVFIVGAGAAAHLAGVVAAHSTLPVTPSEFWVASTKRCKDAGSTRSGNYGCD